MGLFDQILLGLYTLSLTLISALLILVAFGWELPLAALQQVLLDPTGRWALAIVAALFFLSSVRMMRLALSVRKSNEALVRQSELGEVQVSLAAIENLVTRLGKQVDGVRDLKCRVGGGDSGIRLHLRAAVAGDMHIPGLAERLQEALQRQVRQVVGVDVEYVRLRIDEIGDGRGRRGES